ncbi:hypothetical protein HER10_EVM0003333 [Colletotrichum scovillei]|uniref:uncharacterized protein n=1 Tax=Colletotrichum scovillei TaxID=1209932 RepID=UPI0015C2C941|nr:uncharacterized protein HER10_EVM0003333 [Colletotrichum scovillei]KAF4772780.1 hypothetical protein HER10_EVM0003333 [Colletotrichum scovillei]
MSNGRDPPVSARTRSAASTGIISDAMAAEIEEQFRLPVGHPNRQNDEAVRANWRVLYQDWLNGKMNNLCRNRHQWSRANASSSMSTATALSARRFNGSILDVDGLSNVDLSTAASDMRRRIIGIINKDPEHFRAEIERRRQAHQQQQDKDKGKDTGKGPEQQQPPPPPQQRALAQLRRAGAGGAGIAGSDFHSATQIDKRMDQLLAQQEASLLEALRIECEMKALWWLKQRATQGPK